MRLPVVIRKIDKAAAIDANLVLLGAVANLGCIAYDSDVESLFLTQDRCCFEDPLILAFSKYNALNCHNANGLLLGGMFASRAHYIPAGVE
jgi:hypothetical protein